MFISKLQYERLRQNYNDEIIKNSKLLHYKDMFYEILNNNRELIRDNEKLKTINSLLEEEKETFIRRIGGLTTGNNNLSKWKSVAKEEIKNLKKEISKLTVEKSKLEVEQKNSMLEKHEKEKTCQNFRDY